MLDLSCLESVAVTGASGFIGTHLVRALIDGGCRPVLLTRSNVVDEAFAIQGHALECARIDLAESKSIQETLDRVRPSTILHLAGTRGHDGPRPASVACMEVNFDATARLLDAAMNTGVRRIVIIGSAEEYGNQSGPLDETMPLLATSDYGISKAKATSRALEMHKTRGCPVVVARPFSVYGPGQPSNMFVAQAIESAVTNVEFAMSLGEQKRDLIFIDDVVRGVIAAACAPGVEGQVINLGTGRAHRLRDVAERIWRMTGTRARLLIGNRHAPAEELYDTWADITLARRLLDWEPQVDLENGLAQTIDFARNEGVTKARLCQAM
jgi:dTDP-glucose 4,6-dehydratase